MLYKSMIRKCVLSSNLDYTYIIEENSANRPGSVKPCIWIAHKGWQNNVAEVRKLALVYNDMTSYQKMLHEYLQRCPDATKNVYTQFCVEVGLQDKVQDSLQRWINVTPGA